MKIILTTLVTLAFLALSGCSGQGIKADVMGANIEIAKQRAAAAAKPILDARIPVPGCKALDGQEYKDACVMTIVVHAPQGPGNGQVTMPDDAWARVAERAVGGLVTAGGIYLGGEAAASIVAGTATGIVNALKVQPAPTVVQTPNPVIVPSADPVIVNPFVVTQPAPVVVEPVIVNQPVVVEPVIIP